MNWGKKIMILYAVFVLGIMFLVFKSMNMEQDLVTPDYYMQELKYQERIDEKNRTAELDSKLVFSKYDEGIQMTFPEEIFSAGFAGEVWIYCPSDKNKDLKLNINLKKGEESIRIPYPFKGYRQIKINGRSNGVTYYFEEKINL